MVRKCGRTRRWNDPEKVQALGEAQTTASIEAIKGGSSHHVAKKVLGVYKKRVRRNRRRLTR
jgi:hypothetical protein